MQVLSEEIKKGNATITIIDPYKKTRLDETDFDMTEPIAEGCQGSIYAAIVEIEGDSKEYQCVVKRLRRKSCFRSFDSNTSFTKEKIHIPFEAYRNIMDSRDRTPHVVELIHVFSFMNEHFALMPYCTICLDVFLEQTLTKLYYDDRRGYIAAVLEIILGVLVALLYINYTKNYIHGDVKLENIVYHNGKWCLIDFECSTQIGTKITKFVGAPYYMHPSLFREGEKHTHPGTDLYAAGLVLQQLLFQPSKFESFSLKELSEKKYNMYKESLEQKYIKQSRGNNETHSKNLAQTSNVLDELIQLSEKMSTPLLSDHDFIDDVIFKIKALIVKNNDEGETSLSEIYQNSANGSFFSNSGFGSKSIREERRKSSIAQSLFIDASTIDSSDSQD